MPIATLLVPLALTSLLPAAAGRDGDAARIEAVRQHIATFEMSARQVKQKTDADPQKLSSLEQQYGEAATAVETWRTAAVSVKGSAGDSTKRVEDLARQAARAMADFGRDARGFLTGRPSAVEPRAYARFEERLIEASRALSRADEPTREKVYASLGCRTWSEIR
jgi:hypothetical protein